MRDVVKSSGMMTGVRRACGCVFGLFLAGVVLAGVIVAYPYVEPQVPRVVGAVSHGIHAIQSQVKWPKPTITTQPGPASSPTVPPSALVNPSANSPSSYLVACSGGVTLTCQQAEVTSINEARASEGLGQLNLPTGFYQRPPAEQLWVLINLERTSRGLAPLIAMGTHYDQQATAEAWGNADPTLGNGIVAGSWASDFGPIAVVFDWLYSDGPGSINIDCQPGGNMTGCWGHRDNMLINEGSTPLTAGVGCIQYQPVALFESCTILISTNVAGSTDYTWAQVG
ncbi:MAG TPA: hypothetical protein VMV23_00350 [Candidatus Nanopelagicaceae bacterium]|nr:hypothetical protein [Candidatus Nanopelagicaceae bacterium]